MKNYQKMAEDYPSDLSSSDVGENIPMQVINHRPNSIPNNQIPNDNRYHRQPVMFPPSHPSHPSHPSIDYPARLPPPPPLNYNVPPYHPQNVTQQNMIPVRIPNYAHNESEPVMVVCPCCKERVVTEVVRTPGKATYAAALLICVITPILAWIPFCTKKKCKDVRHYCPSCGMKLGKKNGQICG